MTNELEAPDLFSPYHDGSMQHDKDGGWVSIDDYNALSDAKDARIAELEANINIKADWIEATINDMAGLDQELHEMKARADEAEAKLAKAVRLMELSVELATWNTTLLDDVILFITELKESEA